MATVHTKKKKKKSEDLVSGKKPSVVGQDIQFSLRAEIYPLTDPAERKTPIDTRFPTPGTRVVALEADENENGNRINNKKDLTRVLTAYGELLRVFGSLSILHSTFFLHPTTEP